MRGLPAELAVFQLCRENVIPIGRIQVDFKDVVPEGRGGDLHASLGRRNRAGDLLSILLQLERKGRFILLSSVGSTVGRAFPGAGQQPWLGLLVFRQGETRYAQDHEPNSRQAQNALHKGRSFSHRICLRRKEPLEFSRRQKWTTRDSTAVLRERLQTVAPPFRAARSVPG